MAERTIIDIDEVIVTGGAYRWEHPITRDGEAYLLTDKTVTARIRAEHDPDVVVDASLESIAVTVVDGEAGMVRWDMPAAMSALLNAPVFPSLTKPYTLQYHVVEDDYYPDLVRFYASRAG